MKSLADIDWPSWNPVDRATLLFVVQDGKILLIRKKRGLGAGKINGPGGRIDAGELPVAAAIREAQEEIGITPLAPEERGELSFQFVDGYSIHVHVFRSASFSGELRETDEATPHWFALADIPYDEMWADDRIWLPLMLDDQPCSGRFLFDGDAMLDYRLTSADPAAPP